MCLARSATEPYIHWIIGHGNCSTWFDNWLPDATLVRPDHSSINYVHDIFSSPSTISPGASRLIGLRAVAAIAKANIFLSDDLDKACWSGTNGEFTLSSAWHLSRRVYSIIAFAKFIWFRYLPRQVSIFMWRLLRFRLPLDENLIKRGVQLASCCAYCSSRQIETYLYVFLQSLVAENVWGEFQRLSVVAPVRSSIAQTCFSWWYSHRKSTLHTNLPSLIFWELWKHRNRSLYDGICSLAWVLVANIKREFFSIMQVAGINFHPTVSWPLSSSSSIRMGRIAPKVIRIIHWSKPSEGLVKLNTDGACRGNPGVSGGGGIVHDAIG